MRLRDAVVGITMMLVASGHTGAFAAAAQPDERVTYKIAGDTKLELHLFKPPNQTPADRRPCIVFFFGGGWVRGTPSQFYEQARYFANRGLVALSAEYRVKRYHGVTPFECVRDGKSAIRWIRQHAGELGIDPEKIIASGGSAGGHMAACAGGIKGYDEPGEDLTISSIPNAMILFNPVLDTTEQGYGVEKVGANRKTDISPCHHVAPGIPPALIFHGTKDKTVPFENAERFTRQMKAAGNICQLVPFEGKGHGFFNSQVFRPESDSKDFRATMQAADSFLVSLGFLKPRLPAL